MIRDLGIVQPGTTLYIPFHTYDSNDPSASVTLTGLATTDIEIYKDGSVTQRASDNGYTLLDTDGIDFDGVTGIHGLSINLADNSTAGFYAAGSQYWVVVSSVTIDAATVNFILCTFRIGYPNALFNTTIATLSSQTSFTLTAGPAEDDALNGCVVCIHDVASAVQMGYAVVSDYTGSTKTVTLAAGTTFTAAATDNIAIYPPTNLHLIAGSAVSTSSAQLGVNVVNAAGTAWGSGAITAASIASDAITAAKIAAGAIDAATFAADVDAEILSYLVDDATRIDASALNTATGTSIPDILTDTSTTLQGELDGIQADTEDIQSRLPASLVSGRIDASVGAMAANVVTASAIADGAIDRATFAADTGLQTIRSNTAQAGAGTTITLDASASAVDDFYNNSYVFLTGGTGVGQARFISDYVGSTKVATVNAAWATNPDNTSTFAILPFSTIPGASAPTAAEVADAVWDEDATAHQTQGTFGQAIGDPGSDSDTIWALANTNLNATISSRASQTSLDTVDDFLDTEIAAIKAKTDNLPSDPADASDIAAAFAALPTAGDIVDAIWDEALADHQDAGSVGEALGDASSAGDPWNTALPGSYGSGTAGKIIGDNINATISSRASQASLDTVDDFLDTEIAAIKAKTDNLPSDPADASDIAASLASIDAKIDTIDDFLDTEVAAIKAKTDSLNFGVAGKVDANITHVNEVEVTGNGQPGTEWGP